MIASVTDVSKTLKKSIKAFTELFSKFKCTNVLARQTD